MSEPKRIQLSRKRGWRMPDNTIKVTRPHAWSNPFVVGSYKSDEKSGWAVSCDSWMAFFDTKEEAQKYAVQRYREAVTSPAATFAIRRQLSGRNLACWCAIGSPCHADVLLELANP